MGRKGQRRSLKRLFAPKNWRIERKVKEWTIKPIPGPQRRCLFQYYITKGLPKTCYQ